MAGRSEMQKPLIVIREGRKSDCKEIKRLIEELADFEKMPNGPKISAELLEIDGFERSPPLFGCFVAECTESPQHPRLVGYALYYSAYSTWNGKKLYLEDLYVSEGYRRRQVGAELFQRVARKTVSEDYAYLEFSVLAWNPARAFYETRGAVNMTESEAWNTYRMTGEALLRAANV